MAKKAATNPAPAPSPAVPETVEVEVVATETEATTSAAMDQPAVSDDASASSFPAPTPELVNEPEAPSSPAEPAVVEPVVEVVPESTPAPSIIKGGGGGFDSPFADHKPAPTMVERIELLEKRVAILEG